MHRQCSAMLEMRRSASFSTGARHGNDYPPHQPAATAHDRGHADAQAGVDVVLDMVGAPYVERNLRCLALEGCLLQIAFLEGSHFDFDATPIMLRRLTLTGSTLRARSDDQKADIARRLEAAVWPLLEQGRCLPVIHSVFPLADAGAAHALMESSRHIGKIMLSVKEHANETR